MANSMNLLQITTTPAQIQISTTRASLESPGVRMPRQNVRVNRGGIHIQSRPAQMNIDSYAARSSMGYGNYNPVDFMREEAQRAWQLTRDGVSKMVDNGNALARGQSPAEIAAQNHRANFSIETFTDFIPKTGPVITVTEGMIDVDVRPNEVTIDWEHIQAERMIFNPGSVEITVKQHAEVKIEFVGEPLYFPASANPNYSGS
jgi:hypothetical protein